MTKPIMSRDPLFQLLRGEEVANFNERRARGDTVDLRGLIADGLDFRDCYLRMSDLRGIDFRKANLEGVSLASANISGCYFPKELSASEITLSVSQGTRMRYHTP